MLHWRMLYTGAQWSSGRFLAVQSEVSDPSHCVATSGKLFVPVVWGKQRVNLAAHLIPGWQKLEPKYWAENSSPSLYFAIVSVVILDEAFD